MSDRENEPGTFADALIDAALAASTTPEQMPAPRQLAAATMLRVERWKARRRKIRLGLFAAAASTAAVLLAVILLLRPPASGPALIATRNPPPQISTPATRPVSLQPVAGAHARPGPVHSGHRARFETPSPKLDQFPSPIPITPEERALAILACSPQAVAGKVLPLQEEPQAPVTFSELNNEPLLTRLNTHPLNQPSFENNGRQ